MARQYSSLFEHGNTKFDGLLALDGSSASQNLARIDDVIEERKTRSF